MTKDTFTAHTAWYEVISVLHEKEQLAIYKRLFLFHSGRQEEIPLDTEGLKTVWKAIEIHIKPKRGNTIKTWKNDFTLYLEYATTAFNQLLSDKDYITEKERLYPHIDVRLTLEKSFRNYWATESAWKKKKRSKSQTINWKVSFSYGLEQRFNQVRREEVGSAGGFDDQLCEWEIISLKKTRQNTYKQYLIDQKRYGVENVKFIGYVR